MLGSTHFIRYILSLIAVLSLYMFIFSLYPVEAANLEFDPTNIEIQAGETFDVDINVNAGSDQILAVDSYILFNSQDLEVVRGSDNEYQITNGTYFPTVFNNVFTDKVYIAGIVEDPATFKTGSGTIATITFKALRDTTGQLTFYCDETVSDSSKIIKNDVDSTNIINCSENNSVTYTVGGGSSDAQPTRRPTPSALPKTGMVENMLKFGLPGAILLLIGVGTRMVFL